MWGAITAASHELVESFTYTSALASLLTTEGLLFAALALAVNLSVPGGRRVRRLPVPGPVLGGVAVAVLGVVALGAAAAWGRIFLCDFPSDPSGILIAVALIVAIVAQPVLAIVLGLGLRTAK